MSISNLYFCGIYSIYCIFFIVIFLTVFFSKGQAGKVPNIYYVLIEIHSANDGE